MKLTAEKSREDFEKWASAKFDTRLLKSDNGDYKLTALQNMWLSWQESRQALEIALPVLDRQSEMVSVGFTGSGSLATIKAGGEGFIWGSKADAHPIELFARCKDNACEKCKGTGQMDSGGTQPWGDAITVTCDCQPQPSTNPQIDNDGWLEWGEWIEWGGGKCPVKESDWIEARLRDGEEAGGLACHGEWEHKSRSFDIVAYRVAEAYRVIEIDGREG